MQGLHYALVVHGHSRRVAPRLAPASPVPILRAANVSLGVSRRRELSGEVPNCWRGVIEGRLRAAERPMVSAARSSGAEWQEALGLGPPPPVQRRNGRRILPGSADVLLQESNLAWTWVKHAYRH